MPDVGGAISADAANEILSGLREYTIFDKMLVNGYAFPQDKDVIEPLFWKMRDYTYEDDKELYIRDRQENAPFLPEWEDSGRYSYWMREDMLAKEGFELGKTSNFYSSRSGSLYGSGSPYLGRLSAYLGTGDPGNLMMGANLCTTVPSLVAERQG